MLTEGLVREGFFCRLTAKAEQIETGYAVLFMKQEADKGGAYIAGCAGDKYI
jgi:hypothetical protein